MSIKYMRRCQIFDSSNIDEAWYESRTKELYVVFNNGSRYVYETVEPEEFGQLVAAQSTGSYLNKFIKPGHKYHAATSKDLI